MVSGLESLDLVTYMAILTPFIVAIAVWSLAWKGIALWKAARQKQMIWFIVLLVVNTLGILEILYIFWFSKMSSSKKEAPVKKKRR
ncbi:MAG: DUF5652 family protein [Candidatus Pacearchaeota archaeon]|jgi:methionyl-tRNA synthetase